MKFALDHLNQPVSADELALGTLAEKQYQCPECGDVVYFVRCQDRSSHFRHASEATCVVSPEWFLNRKSEFHRAWQAVFPVECREVKLTESGQTQIADIFLDHGRRSTVIEIQHSPIGIIDAMQRERFYRTDNRALVWIFDTTAQVDHIQTTVGEFYRVQLQGKSHFTGLLINADHPCVLLDTGSIYLYQVSTRSLVFDYLHVKPILRSDFISQVQAGTFNRPLIIRPIFRKTETESASPEEMPLPPVSHVSERPDGLTINYGEFLPGDQAHELNKFFYLLEALTFYQLINRLPQITRDVLRLAAGNRDIIDYYYMCVARKKPRYQDVMPSGKYKGWNLTDLSNHDLAYLKKYYHQARNSCPIKPSCRALLLLCDEDFLQKEIDKLTEEDPSCLGLLIYLYRKQIGQPKWYFPE